MGGAGRRKEKRSARGGGGAGPRARAGAGEPGVPFPFLGKTLVLEGWSTSCCLKIVVSLGCPFPLSSGVEFGLKVPIPRSVGSFRPFAMGVGASLTHSPLSACLSRRLLSSSSLRPFFLLSISLLAYFLLDLWQPRFLPDISGECDFIQQAPVSTCFVPDPPGFG